MMYLPCRRLGAAAAAVLALSAALPVPLSAWAQSPGAAALPPVSRGADPFLNRHYLNADVERWREIFESPGREVFDQRLRIVHESRVRPGMRVADIGAGSGLFTVLFARAVGPEGKVYAVDISPSFIAGIEERAREYRVKNVVPLLGTQDSTPLAPGSVDLAFVSDTYHHFENPQGMLQSIRDALVPYGSLVVVDFHRIPGVSSPWILGHVRAPRERVIAEIEAAGFRLADAPDFMDRNYFLRFERLEGDGEVSVGPVESPPAGD